MRGDADLSRDDGTGRRCRRAPSARASGIDVVRQDHARPALWRYLYTEVGTEYHWIDRLRVDRRRNRRLLADPARLALAARRSTAARRLLRAAHGARRRRVEIAYFGLLPEFIGRGLGGHLLTEAVERAWALGATPRLAAHLELDHPSAHRSITSARLHHLQDRTLPGALASSPRSLRATSTDMNEPVWTPSPERVARRR